MDVASGKCSFSITFSCVSDFYEMQKLETQFFFLSTSKNNNYVFSIYTRYQAYIRPYCYIDFLI